MDHPPPPFSVAGFKNKPLTKVEFPRIFWGRKRGKDSYDLQMRSQRERSTYRRGLFEPMGLRGGGRVPAGGEHGKA